MDDFGELKEGDEVIVKFERGFQGYGYEVKVVTRVTKTQLTVGAHVYNKKYGTLVGRSKYLRRELRHVTDETIKLVEEYEYQKRIETKARELSNFNYDDFLKLSEESLDLIRKTIEECINNVHSN